MKKIAYIMELKTWGRKYEIDVFTTLEEANKKSFEKCMVKPSIDDCRVYRITYSTIDANCKSLKEEVIQAILWTRFSGIPFSIEHDKEIMFDYYKFAENNEIKRDIYNVMCITKEGEKGIAYSHLNKYDSRIMKDYIVGMGNITNAWVEQA